MDILRVTARWSGFVGAPGYSNFFFAGGGGLISDAQQVAERVRAAFGELANLLPDTVTIDIERDVAVVDSDTGVVQDYRQISALEPRSGTGTGGYSAATGAVVNWMTNDVRFGRRIRGRTFVVPVNGSAYEDDGTLTEAALSVLEAFADELTARDFDSEFGVWSRPRDGAGGVFATVNSYRIPDMAAVLRSRRD